MATASILQAHSIPSPFHHEIMAPSSINQSPRARHGRGKSFSNKSGRARGLSNATPPVNEREASLTKGLNWILRHRQDQGILELDEDGFVDCAELLNWQYMSNLSLTFPELQTLLEHNPTARQRFTLKPKSSSNTESEEASDWLLGTNQIPLSPKSKKTQSLDIETMANLEAITLASENIPEVVMFQTTYSAYPLILASGSLENSSGHYIHCSSEISGDAEVLIYIDVQKALEQESSMLWYKGEGKSSIVTDGGEGKSVSKAFWKKVVGRKNEVGLLWEDGEVVKEVPFGLRGKTFKGKGNGREKGKAGKGAGLRRRDSLDAHSEEEEAAVEAVKNDE